MGGGKSFQLSLKPGLAVEAGDASDEKMDMDTRSIQSPNSLKITYAAKDGGESGFMILTFAKDGVTERRNVDGVNYTGFMKRLGTAVDQAASYTINDLLPVVAGTYEWVRNADSEKLLAKEGTLDDENKEQQAGKKIRMTVGLTQDAVTLNYNAVGGKSFQLSLKPGLAVEAADASDEKMDMDTLSIQSPNSLKITYAAKDGGESGFMILTFTKDGVTERRNVDGVNYTGFMKRLGTAVDKAASYTISDLLPVVAGTYEWVRSPDSDKLLAKEGTLGDENKEQQAGKKIRMTVGLTQDAVTLNYNAVGGKSFQLSLKPGLAVEAGDAFDEKMDMDTLSIQSPNSLKITYAAKDGGESGFMILSFAKDVVTERRNVDGVNYNGFMKRV